MHVSLNHSFCQCYKIKYLDNSLKTTNEQLKDFAASRTNVLVSFIKNKIRKQPNQSDVNKEEITEQYLESEKKRATEPTQWWLNIYIFVHLIKAPVLAPMIFLLILGNGGKIIK